MRANVEYWKSVAEIRETSFVIGVSVGAGSFVALIITIIVSCVMVRQKRKEASTPRASP